MTLFTCSAFIFSIKRPLTAEVISIHLPILFFSSVKEFHLSPALQFIKWPSSSGPPLLPLSLCVCFYALKARLIWTSHKNAAIRQEVLRWGPSAWVITWTGGTLSFYCEAQRCFEERRSTARPDDCFYYLWVTFARPVHMILSGSIMVTTVVTEGLSQAASLVFNLEAELFLKKILHLFFPAWIAMD